MVTRLPLEQETLGSKPSSPVVRKISINHKQIVGDFGEHLVLYLLSKNGYECVLANHVGIDIIVKDHKRAENLGISVKTRCRFEGKEKESVSIPKSNFYNLSKTCRIFNLIPYFAIVSDTEEEVSCMLFPYEELKKIIGKAKNPSISMTEESRKKYKKNKNIKIFKLCCH